MSLSEKVLGRRVVNYLKNEALVGRINNQKLQVSSIKDKDEFENILEFYLKNIGFVWVIKSFDKTKLVLWQRTSVIKVSTKLYPP